jgi:hypothetical protein
MVAPADRLLAAPELGACHERPSSHGSEHRTANPMVVGAQTLTSSCHLQRGVGCFGGHSSALDPRSNSATSLKTQARRPSAKIPRTDFESEGSRFESCRARSFPQTFSDVTGVCAPATSAFFPTVSKTCPKNAACSAAAPASNWRTADFKSSSDTTLYRSKTERVR